jgi:hypothetical protein
VAITLANMQVALKRYGFDDNDPLTTWLNASYRFILDQYDWPQREWKTGFVLTSGYRYFDQSMITSGTVIFEMIRFLEVDGKNLIQMGPEEWARVIEDQDETGTPEYYKFINDKTFQLWPVPDAAYAGSITLRMGVADLTNPTDVPSLPDSLHYSVVQGAAAIGLEAENEEDRASTERGAVQQAVDNAIAKLRNASGSTVQTVVDAQGYFNS